MPVGVVRGRFELDAPALRVLKDLERQGIRTQRQIDALAKSIDKVGDKTDTARVRALNREIRDLGASSERSARRTDDSFRKMSRSVEREVAKQTAAVDAFSAKLDEVGRKRVVPEVDLDGIAEALAQVELLDKRLAALGATRANPRVSVGGGVVPSPTGGGARGGGGGFGGGDGGLKSVGLGPFNLGSRAGLAAIGAGLPGVRALAGAVTALGGSLGYAAAGAGGLGAAGGGGLAVGLAGVIAVAKPAANAIKETAKAQEGYNQALQQYGKNSDQARVAKAKLDEQMKVAPRGTRQLLRDVTALRKEWVQLTEPGQSSLMQLAVGATNDARGFARNGGARAANRVSRATAREGGEFSRFATGRQGRRLASTGAGIFDENLGNFEKSAENAATAFVNITRAARPFFREGTDWLERWTRGWAESTDDLEETRSGLRSGVNSLRQWKDLSGTTFRLLRDIARAGRPSGDSLVGSLNETLTTWDRWIQRNPAKTRAFMAETVESTKKLGSGLVEVVDALDKMADTLTPLLDGFSTLLTGAGSLGLLTPGAGALAFGALRGVRGRGGRGAGGGGVGGAGGGSAALPGAALAAGGAGALRSRLVGPNGLRSNYGISRAFGNGRVASAAGALRGPAGALGATGGGVAAGALRGAGRAFAPVAAMMALLDFAGTQGNVGNRLQGALSGASLGLVDRPETRAQRSDRWGQVTGGFVDRRVNSLPMTVGGTQTGLERTNAEIARLQARLGAPKRRELGDATGVGIALDFGSDGTTKKERQGLQERIKLLRQERDTVAASNRALRDQQRQRLDQRSAQKGQRFAGEFQERFTRQSKKVGEVEAAEDTRKKVLSQMRTMRRSGRKELAAGTLEWLNEARRANPKLTGEYRKMAAGVRKQFRDLGQNISIVNGQILTGSRSEWRGIASEISSAMRRGVDKTSSEFDRLRQRAVGSLRAMGFTTAQANRLFKGQSSGSAAQRGQARSDISAGPQALPTGGTTTQSTVDATGAQGVRKNRGGRVGGFHATGGRVGGKGLGDTVNAGSAMVAPGEIVVNRHQEKDADRILRRNGTSLEAITRRNQRRHDQPELSGRPEDRRAAGGTVGTGARAGAASGGVRARGGGMQGGINQLAQAVVAQFPGLSITSTTGGTHAAGSYHYRGLAADIGGPPETMNRAAAWVGSRYGSSLAEGIHNPNLSIKDGRSVPSSFWGASTWAGHRDHLHLAVAGALNGGAAVGGAPMPGAAELIRLKARRSGLAGIPGALADRATELGAAAMEKQINDRIGSAGATSATGAQGKAPAGQVRQWLTAALQHTGHFSPANLNALYSRAMQESGGNPSAINNWDSNAKAGYPSQGLLQTIPQTFASFRDPSIPGGITDPIANAVAAIRYMFSKYGHIVGANGSGYNRGGRVADGKFGSKQNHDGFIGSFEKGGSFTTRPGRGAYFEAGEGGKQERITVEPFRPRRRSASRRGGGSGPVGAGSVHVEVNMGGVTVNTEQDVEEIGERIGEKVLDALRGGGGAVVGG
jgi:hypothetical protein